MRKFLFLFLCIVLFAGCGSDTSSSKKDKKPTGKTDTYTTQTPGLSLVVSSSKEKDGKPIPVKDPANRCVKTLDKTLRDNKDKVLRTQTCVFKNGADIYVLTRDILGKGIGLEAGEILCTPIYQQKGGLTEGTQNCKFDGFQQTALDAKTCGTKFLHPARVCIYNKTLVVITDMIPGQKTRYACAVIHPTNNSKSVLVAGNTKSVCNEALTKPLD